MNSPFFILGFYYNVFLSKEKTFSSNLLLQKHLFFRKPQQMHLASKKLFLTNFLLIK
ncbi:hypothetical protein HMPREF3187_00408 [Aerococcus christensenii]|uniref:Uncharacterized protein n=1 Tax=Aerococcus christensenii TaxID=87541 RepID=A0A133Y3C0_9LACT|nr:hypothetical protein HMPREF3187_00408 [Aerococcus christensenii]